MIRYLKSGDKFKQQVALAEFAGMGEKAKTAVPAIVQALKDPKSSIRVGAAVTLIQMNFQAKAAVSALATEIKSKDGLARSRALAAINQLMYPPKVVGTTCWGPDPPALIARPWVKDAVEQAIK